VKDGWQFYQDVWQPAARAVSNMEQHGLQLDVELCNQRAAECVAKQEEIGRQLNEWAGKEINWASPKQKAEFLYGDRGWSVPGVCGNVRAVKGTKRDARPTDEMAVLHLARTVGSESDRHHLRLYCGYPDIRAKEHEPSWKQAAKLQGFYQGLPAHAEVDGRVHTQLAALTRTGRLTSRNPNLQQIPPSVRDVFVAEPGRILLSFDYSALEWTVLAHIVAKRYQDTSLADELRDGRDPHQATADGMTARLGKPVSRNAAKIINYSINYGKTAQGLAIQLEVTESEAGEMLDAFSEARPGIAQWLRDAADYVKTRGYCRTLLGRFLPIPEIRGDRYKRQQGERKALNYPIQGSAADIVSMAMVRCSEQLNQPLRATGSRLLLQIHDELLFSVPEESADEAAALIKIEMEGCLRDVTEFCAPLKVEGGRGLRWGDC
jgi:DNA polymerase-1